MYRKLLAAAVAAVAIVALAASPASAGKLPRLWTDSTMTTPLRSVTTPPKDQPDALEFVNLEAFGFELRDTSETPFEPAECTEVEFGTAVVTNLPEEELKVSENKLAMPFGVAEGDNCFSANGLPVRLYFDTNPTGGVPATITFSGAGPLVFKGKIHKLKLSTEVVAPIPNLFCTITLENTELNLQDVTEGFVEENPPNLTASLVPGATGTETCPPSKLKHPINVKGSFFLETMSTTTDTAFIG
jgi:hypothetical protein